MDVDVIDSIRRAIIAFDEPILFHGEAGAMRLTPNQLKGWGVGLKGDYHLRIPINKRADYSLGLELMAPRKAADAIGPSDPLIPDNLFATL